MSNNQDKVYERALTRTLKETDDIMKKVRLKQDFQDREVKELLKDVGGTIVDLDQDRLKIDKELETTTDKNKRLELLEQYRNKNAKIQRFWEERNKRWTKGLDDIENDKK